MFCGSLFVLLSFSFGHCIVCPISIYGVWLPLWYLKSFHTEVLIPDRRFIVSGWVIVVYRHVRNVVSYINADNMGKEIGLWCLTPLSLIFFSYIWRSVFIGGGNRSIASHWQTLTHNIVWVHLTIGGIRTYYFIGDRNWLYM